MGSDGSKKSCLRLHVVQIPRGKGQFLGKGRHCNYRDSAVTCAKIAEPIVMQFGLLTRSASRNHEIDGVPVLPLEGTILAERVPRCKVWALSAVSCAETDEPIDLPLRLWTRVCLKKNKSNRIRQVAPMRPPLWAHWRQLTNTTEPSVCSGDAVLCQITLTTS